MKNIFLIAGLVLLENWCIASVISPQDAQTVAVNYFKSKSQAKLLNATLAYTQIDKDGTVDFYVFDMTPEKGFVIVSAIDNIEPILAYSGESNFKPDVTNHTGLTDWMNLSTSAIAAAVRLNLQATVRTKTLWTAYLQGTIPTELRSDTVGPLVTTTWNQENDVTGTRPPYLYNLLCPFNSTDNQRALVGCVPTAMAQIMKYWNFPPQGTGSVSYNDTTPYKLCDTCATLKYVYGEQSANFGATTYAWDEMPNVLNGTETLAQDSAVDVLMYQCGVAAYVAYGDDKEGGTAGNVGCTPAAGSPCAESALCINFGYNANTIKGATPTSDTANWVTLLETELNAGRPMMYTGNTTNDGHCWVCDGYNTENLIHMNWGWGGVDNGFYSVYGNIFPPGEYNFTNGFSVVMGIQPGVSCNGTIDLGSGSLTTLVTESSQTIYSENSSPAKANVTLDASSSVILRPGFLANSGSTFYAFNNGCSAPLSPETKNPVNQLSSITALTSTDGIQIMPNPFNSSFELSVTVNNDEPASIIIYNTLGAQVKELKQQQLTAGRNAINFDCSELASGIYLVEIKAGDTRTVKKIVKN
jgi:hypothetical protein